jgi:hypothetical protein
MSTAGGGEAGISEAASEVDRHRLQPADVGTDEGVTSAVLTAIDGYLATHPGTSPQAIERGLHIALGIYRPDDDLDLDGSAGQPVRGG